MEFSRHLQKFGLTFFVISFYVEEIVLVHVCLCVCVHARVNSCTRLWFIEIGGFVTVGSREVGYLGERRVNP